MTKQTDNLEGFWTATLFSLAGPQVWTLHLGLVYGFQHVICAAFADGYESLFVRGFILAVTAIALFALFTAGTWPNSAKKIRVWARVSQRQALFLTRISQSLMLLSLFAVFWQGAAVLFFSECPALR